MSDGDKLLLRIPEAAKLLGLSPRRLYGLAARRAFPDGLVIKLGRSILFSRPRLRAWLESEDYLELYDRESEPVETGPEGGAK